MTFDDIIRSLSCKTFVRGAAFDTAKIKSLVASDLMSDVLTTTEENFIISTSLNSEQVVRTADIVGALGILLVNGKQPQDAMRQLAADHGITLLSTTRDTYRVCVTVGCALEREKSAAP
ncbi:MAG: hypothetical protein RBT16_11425 [Desulfococcus multivorans]|jgi:predicted transcriptional regulator|nr:hypothetical protein [Desulfococcus multivorans]